MPPVQRLVPGSLPYGSQNRSDWLLALVPHDGTAPHHHTHRSTDQEDTMSTTPTSQRKTRRPLVVHLYRDTDRKWRWRAVSRNGHTLATPGEGYSRRIDCVTNAGIVLGFFLENVQWLGKAKRYAQVSPTTRTDFDFIELKVVTS